MSAHPRAGHALGDLRVPRRLAGQCFRRRATSCCASAMATRGVASASTGTRALGHERDRRGRRSPMRELDKNQERTAAVCCECGCVWRCMCSRSKSAPGGHPRKGLIPRRRPAAPLSQRHSPPSCPPRLSARLGAGNNRCGAVRAAMHPTPAAGTRAPAPRSAGGRPQRSPAGTRISSPAAINGWRRPTPAAALTA